VKLRELAERLGCERLGDGEVELSGVAGLEQAGPGDLTFLANARYARCLETTRASAVIVAPGHDTVLPRLVADNPYLLFTRAVALICPPARPAPGIHPSAQVHASAVLGKGVHVGALAVVGAGTTVGARSVLHPHVVLYADVTVGEDCLIHSGVQIRERCRLGNRVVVQNGAVIGGDGFGFAKRSDGTHEKIVQSGVTVIEDDVEIQTLTSVDRATVGETRVKRGAKIDSLVQVGHACVVGEDNIICAQTGLAGSSVLERNVLLAGQVGVSGHLTIHDNAVVYAQSGVGGDVAAGACISGSPAFETRDWLRAVTAFPRLPELLRALRQLERRVQELEAQASSK
jgi:UDP-3-O-[3-hydroxymyristoyl] glucosamine N-acyltransferase